MNPTAKQYLRLTALSCIDNPVIGFFIMLSGRHNRMSWITHSLAEHFQYPNIQFYWLRNLSKMFILLTRFCKPLCHAPIVSTLLQLWSVMNTGRQSMTLWSVVQRRLTLCLPSLNLSNWSWHVLHTLTIIRRSRHACVVCTVYFVSAQLQHNAHTSISSAFALQ